MVGEWQPGTMVPSRLRIKAVATMGFANPSASEPEPPLPPLPPLPPEPPDPPEPPLPPSPKLLPPKVLPPSSAIVMLPENGVNVRVVDQSGGMPDSFMAVLMSWPNSVPALAAVFSKARTV